MQDTIYREKVLRARAMTEQERFTSGLELTQDMFERMLAGALHRLETKDEELGWQEVKRWMTRLKKVHDHRFYASQKPDS